MPGYQCQSCQKPFRTRRTLCQSCALKQPRLHTLPEELLKLFASFLPFVALWSLLLANRRLYLVFNIGFLQKNFGISEFAPDTAKRILKNYLPFWREVTEPDINNRCGRRDLVFRNIPTGLWYQPQELDLCGGYISRYRPVMKFQVVSHSAYSLTFGIKQTTTLASKMVCIAYNIPECIYDDMDSNDPYFKKINHIEQGVWETTGKEKFPPTRQRKELPVTLLPNNSLVGEVITISTSFLKGTVDMYIGDHLLHTFKVNFDRDSWYYAIYIWGWAELKALL